MTRTLSVSEMANDFLAQRSLALIGASRNEKDYSRWLMRRLRDNGYVVFAINPHVQDMEGSPCYKHVSEIPVPVDGALLMTAEDTLPLVIAECVAVGIKRLWVYGVGHPRKLDRATRVLCEGNEVQLINGLCPMMFLHDAAWPHKLHGWVSRKFMYRPTTM